MRQYLLLFIIGLAFIGCKSNKIINTGPAPIFNDGELISALENRNTDWNWLVAKAGINIDSPDEKVGGTMYLRMKKDSVIWIMVKKFGVEAARAQLTPDSFTIIYRFDRAYDTGRLSSLMHHYNLDLGFEDMQQMLFGNVMLLDTTTQSVKQSTDTHIISGHSGDLSLTYYLDPYTLLLDRMHIIDSRQRDVVINYDDYEDKGQYGMIPMDRFYTLPYSTSEKATLEVNFKEFDIDKPRAIKFNVSPNYRKL